MKLLYLNIIISLKLICIIKNREKKKLKITGSIDR